VFQALIDDAKSTAASFVEKYLVRASVAVPFVVALGFATAAAALALTERFGAKTAFWILAAGFSAIGVLAAIVVTIKEQEAETAVEQEDRESGLGDFGEIASAAATQTAGQLPLGLLTSFLANPSAALAGVRLVGRNVPLLLLVALVVLLFWPAKETEETAADEEETCPDARSGAMPEQDPLREAA
jgi:uncharacterized membrane protein